ncbi:MAG: DUF72 domain-containing protein [Gemmatimonadota bacterium]|nr:MAG: DUF72 domain-containing protein [Gemmatimonadota bacterium]
MAAPLLLGCHGWNHQDWVGSYYGSGSGEIEKLTRYAVDFPTVEVADTFAGIPPMSLVESWRDAVPDTFQFAFKVPQQITYERRLVDTGRLICRFLERLVLLENSLGPLLLTISARLAPTADTRAALWNLINSLPAGFKWVLECRRADWLTAALLDLLRSRNVALALADDRWIRRRLMLDLASQPTADFAYVRWIACNVGRTGRSQEPDSFKRTLSMWSPSIAELREKVTCVFGYFSNRFGGDPFPLRAAILQGLVDRSHHARLKTNPLLPTSQLCIFCRNESTRCSCPDQTDES